VKQGRQRYRYMAILLLVFLTVLLPACGRQAEPTADTDPGVSPDTGPPPEPEPQPEPEPAEPGPPAGYLQNSFTGRWLPPEQVCRRPVAVMIDNHPQAVPQFNLGATDLVFEVPVEGGMTRFMAVYLGEAPDQVGPVRSVRHYFLDLALALDAVVAHCGGSPRALQDVRRLQVDAFNDLRGSGGFWRANPLDVDYEHTLFTGLDRLRRLMEERGLERDAPPSPLWAFAGPDQPPGLLGEDGQPVQSRRADELFLRVAGSAGHSVHFVFDPEIRAYRRWQNGKEHRDAAAEAQLSADNLLVLKADIWAIAGDREGRLDMQLVGGGEGMLLTDGSCWDVSWSKEGRSAPLVISGPGGETCRLLPGRTWIEIVDPNWEVQLTSSGDG